MYHFEYLPKGGDRMRQADSTIKGYLYQFNKSILTILEAENDASIVLEGVIEDISSYRKRFKKISFAINSLPPHKKYDSKYREAFYTLIAWRLFHKELDSMNKIERTYPDFVKWIAECTLDVPTGNS